MSIKNKIAFCFMLSLFALVGCKQADDFVEESTKNPSTFSKGQVGTSLCGKTILKFADLGHIQNVHTNLYNQYQASGEDEQTLIDFEQAEGLYSLRQKEQDMDDGVIPNDPSFDAFDYTSDDVFAAMLNEDGMVIIGGYLYVFSDGCVAHRIPFKGKGCFAFDVLLHFNDLVKSGNATNNGSMDFYRNEAGVEDIDICGDPRYDFESISEAGGKFDNDNPRTEKSGADCGFVANIAHDILAHDPINQTIEIRFDASSIAPAGSNPLYSMLIDNLSDYDSIDITNASIPTLIGIDWTTATGGADGFAYPGEWVQILVDYSSATTAPILNARLLGSVAPLSGNSCSDTDSVSIDLACPISMSMQSINATNGEWVYTIEGLEGLSGYEIVWNFGDSTTTTVNGSNSVTHAYGVPCGTNTYTITATIQKIEGLCKTVVLSPNPVTVFDVCKRRTLSAKYKVNYSGKKVRLKMKIKKQASIFGGKTKFKNVMRYRKTGTKTISSSGTVYLQTGNTCTPTNVASVLPSVNQSGKKRLKQKVKDGNIYYADLNAPYQVQFSHSNGFNYVLTYSETCSE
ncbi:hypothetical protein [Pontimicrobium sp. MEBiC06410]